MRIVWSPAVGVEGFGRLGSHSAEGAGDIQRRLFRRAARKMVDVVRISLRGWQEVAGLARRGLSVDSEGTSVAKGGTESDRD